MRRVCVATLVWAYACLFSATVLARPTILNSHTQRHNTRQLLQDRPPIAAQDVTSVSTPEELVAAVRAGALDIVVNDHLDLTTNATQLLPTGICPVGCESPLGVVSNTRSIRGNCTDQPDTRNFRNMNGGPLVPVKLGQCFLLTFDDLLGVVGAGFWADNLYLRAALPRGNDRLFHFPALAVVAQNSRFVYLTNMTFQGDAEGSVVGIGADNKVFIQDSLFTDLGGSRLLACTECSSAVEARAAVTVDRCEFENLLPHFGARFLRAYKGGAVMATNSSFENAAFPFESEIEGPDKGFGIYSDDASGILEVLTVGGDLPTFASAPPNPIPKTPVKDPNDPESPLFLTEFDPWFVALREELLGITIEIPPPPPAEPPAPAPAPEPTPPETVTPSPPTESQSPNPTVTPAVDPPDSATENSSPSITIDVTEGDGTRTLSAGAIGGVTVGAVVGAILLVVLLCGVPSVLRADWRRRRQVQEQKNLGKQKFSQEGTMFTLQQSFWFRNNTAHGIQLILPYRDSYVKSVKPSVKGEGGVTATVEVEYERGEKEFEVELIEPGGLRAISAGGFFKSRHVTVVSTGVEPARLYFGRKTCTAGMIYVMEEGILYEEVTSEKAVSKPSPGDTSSAQGQQTPKIRTLVQSMMGTKR